VGFWWVYPVKPTGFFGYVPWYLNTVIQCDSRLLCFYFILIFGGFL